MQSAFHANLGYVGLAVAYYYLGQEGLARASIIAGFIMILQNILAVVALQTYGEQARRAPRPVAAWCSRFSATRSSWPPRPGFFSPSRARLLPQVVDRTLQIISSLALPMALLLIGATLSLEMLRRGFWRPCRWSACLKLVLLPAHRIRAVPFSWNFPAGTYLPALILLASPTATLTYVMAEEMSGDPQFAVAAISASTLLSAVSYSIWLHLAG